MNLDVWLMLLTKHVRSFYAYPIHNRHKLIGCVRKWQFLAVGLSPFKVELYVIEENITRQISWSVTATFVPF